MITLLVIITVIAIVIRWCQMIRDAWRLYLKRRR
jgi:hypothetical protein